MTMFPVLIGAVPGWVDAILTGLVVLTGLLMTFLILLQEGKGGGLTALGGTKAAGVEGVTNPIRRATAYLAVIFFVLLITMGWLHRPEPKASLGLGDATASTEGAANPAPAAAPAPAAVPAVVPATPKADAPKDAVKETPAVEAKKDEAKKDEAKKEEPKKDESKTDAK